MLTVYALLPLCPCRFSVGGNVIEFVDEWPHLGHIITATSDDKADIIRRRSAWILCSQINNVLCFFGKCDPLTKLSLLKTYCSCFTGVFCGTCHTPLSMPFVPSGARVSGVSGIVHVILTLRYCHCCVVYCLWWMSLCVGVPLLLVAALLATVMLLASLHDTVSFLGECYLHYWSKLVVLLRALWCTALRDSPRW